MLAAIFTAVALAATGPALSDGQMAGTRVITGFSGHHPPEALRRMISTGQISGVILFDGNVGSPRSVRRLTAELQAIPRPAAMNQPLLITVDQEGGLVRRLPGPPKPSAQAIGARGAAFAKRLGRATGVSLHSMGVNVDLAPVLDIGRRGRAIEQEGRTFARTPAGVSKIGVGFARGLAAGGVSATAKHFPGLGAARINTDNAVQKIRLPAGKLRAVDERPFASFAQSGGAMVMLSTAIYPALSGKPAALSHAIATGELRDRLGFQGVSISDALGSVSARAVGGPAKTALAAARAGTDLVLFTDPGDAARAQRALARGLGDGSLDREEFGTSVNRVLALRGSPRA
ncbi:MAG: glycoside hydrolase family 3 N-terminal domain-containing protein [Solirubrobacterales bacterium]